MHANREEKMIKKWMVWGGFGCVLGSSLLHASLADDLMKKAVLESSVIRTVHQDGLMRRTLEAGCLKHMCGALNRAWEEAEERNPYDAVRKILEEDRCFFQWLEKQLAPLTPGRQGVTYQLKTQKMGVVTHLMLTSGNALTLTKDFFNHVVQNKSMPAGYLYSVPAVNVEGASDHIYSSGRGLAFKLFLFAGLRALMGVQGALAVLGPLENHPFVHLTALPTLGRGPAEPTPFRRGSLHGGHDYLLTFHNGYAFGGQRNEDPEEPFGDRWGPQDCTSFVSLYAGCGLAPATVHLATHFQNKQGFFFPQLGQAMVRQWEEEVQKPWQVDSFRPAVEEAFGPLSVTDLSAVTAGTIWIKRNYCGVAQDPAVSIWGKGGHAAFVLGVLGQGPDARVLTLGANRAIEDRRSDGGIRNMDGSYMLQWFPALTTDAVKAESQIFYCQPPAQPHRSPSRHCSVL